VSFDVCSTQEVLGGGAGVIVEQGDWNGLTDAILKLAGDEVALKKIGAAGRRRAKSLFSLPQVVERYEKAFDSVTAD
jgi:glycosyltransferase involved in cell wall biosynthesis